MKLYSESVAATQRRFNRSFYILGAILMLLGLSFSLSILSTQRLYLHTEARRKSLETVIALRTFLRLAIDAETGQRGFLITGDEKFLEPHDAAVGGLKACLDNLENLAVNDRERLERIAQLRTRVESRLAELQKTIAARRAEGFESARQLVLAERGKREMDAIRTVVSDLEDQESGILAQRQAKAQSSFWNAMITEGVTAMLGLAGVAAAGWLLIQNLSVAQTSAVRQFNERQKLGVTLSSIGDAVIATDARSRVTFINPVAQALTGWPAEEALGKPLEAVFRIVHEATREVLENPITCVIREGAVGGLVNHTILIARDGSEYPIDFSAAPIRDEKSQISGVILVFRDIATRRRAEIETQKARTFSENIVDTVRESLLVLNKELRVRSANRSYYRMFQSTPAETIGKQIYLLSDGQWDLPELRLLIEQIGPQNPAAHELEFELTLPALGKRHFFATVRPLIGEKTWSGEILLAIEDITDRKRAEEKLRHEDQRKDIFLATLAHELRNPLAPIRNALSALRMAPDSPKVLADCRATMERQVEQMVRLIDDLLDVSRITIGRIELRRHSIPLQDALTMAMEISAPVIAASEHRLCVDIPAEAIWMDADITRLAQVFANLLNNSARHSNQGGRIWLSAHSADGWAEVRVRDSGYGIPGNMLTRVFEMFARVDRSSAEAPEGLGIGLSLARSLVELHGGTIAVESKGEGHGSEFIVRLPILAEPPTTPDADGLAIPVVASLAATPGDGSAAQHSFRILVVDDNVDACTSLAMLLTMMGHTVEVAHDGLEALAKAPKFKPRVCLLDIGLPQLDGYHLARRIREMSGGPNMVLVAMTGWGQEKDKVQAMEAGFDHHLVKPVDIEVVTEILEAIAS